MSHDSADWALRTAPLLPASQNVFEGTANEPNGRPAGKADRRSDEPIGFSLRAGRKKEEGKPCERKTAGGPIENASKPV
jgi:hypothetical protein